MQGPVPENPVGTTTQEAPQPQVNPSPEAPTTNAATSNPSPEAPQAQPQTPNLNSAEGFAQTTAQTPDTQPAVTPTPPPTEQPTTNNSSQEYIQAPTPTPDVSNQAPQQPTMHEAKSAQELKDLENFKVADADVVKGAPVAGADTSSPEFPGEPQENLSQEAPTENSQTQTNSESYELSESELNNIFKEFGPEAQGSLMRGTKLYRASLKLANGDPDIKDSAKKAMDDTFIRVSRMVIHTPTQENKPTNELEKSTT